MKTRISFAAAGFLLIAGCTNIQDDKVALDQQQGFICQSPGKIVYEAWGPHGLSKACAGPDGVRNGSFFAAERGHVIYRGSYEAGKDHGPWEWLDSNGNVVKRGQGNASEAQ